jgi:hypothetical protein
MRSFIIAAIATLTFASAAHAATAQGRYRLDANGTCRASGGQSVPPNMCQGSFHAACKAGVSKPCGHSCIPLGKTCAKH